MARRGGRWTARAGAALLGLGLTIGLAGCLGVPDAPRPAARAVPEGEPTVTAGNVIGAGTVKVALIVPLSGQGAAVGAALRNAAELAYDDFQKPNLQILVKDDRGTPEGAREATQAAFAEGAEMVLGPLFAANVQAAGGVARGAGKPVIAFSTDAAVAARGVYLISFLPQSEVDRIVDEASAGGRRSFAALIPETVYGNAVEAQFREAVARRGARLVGIERYPAGNPGPAVDRLRGVIAGGGAQADALFVPDTAEGLMAVAPALTKIGFSPVRVRPLGLALWNDPRVLSQAAFQGGRFAAPDAAGFAGFAQRYQTRFGTMPPRTASLGYDAVSLTAALVRQYGSQRFADATLTNPAGFSGLDGTFRFLPDGVSERTLAVYEIRNNAANVVSPAPKVLAPSGI
ncbi:UNVERIFIED_ORG: branched-chain amino acid transport system substrate-binding protein [Methylobacterium sp. SuP10 SLI 274]|uniref:penicillin-binding protein activator n=1 Tax=Methylorubrum extorquens TaxID=408 RepID=UPI0020A0D850|nr:penicillin-binding protein activator [Methylorubrum extorquens]MDF9862185.1 branched-chain amino acid transport system substrate-binding protein [Methylorubrum pseudosasae]MDH6635805.1 branched-chain amino acid transport system substrate-binding protein [Methylobacterium sp. SuP10 SLI 274]MDH6664978.1 branched-chain amino acid transport system substrate-binding protein [Methylorubrum zatmanii]MCP1556906.1 ABC-type branched-subunit amino acid transport system substrate-binding protein [Methyl